MDNFTDKLVERINAQGSVRTRGYFTDPDIRNERTDKEQLEALEESMTGRLAEFEEKLAGAFTENVAEAVKETNALNAEMLTQYRNENLESRLSATQELMAGQAQLRNEIIQALASNGAETTMFESIATGLENSKQEILDKLGSASVSDELIEEINNKLDALSESLSDHVHKECVKVYRNVQASVDESVSKHYNKVEVLIRTVADEYYDKLICNIRKAIGDGIAPNAAAADNGEGKLSKLLLGVSAANLIGIIIALLWMFKII